MAVKLALQAVGFMHSNARLRCKRTEKKNTWNPTSWLRKDSAATTSVCYTKCHQIQEANSNAWCCERETLRCTIWHLTAVRGRLYALEIKRSLNKVEHDGALPGPVKTQWDAQLSCWRAWKWQQDVTFWTCPFWLVWSSPIRQPHQRIAPPIRKDKNNFT